MRSGDSLRRDVLRMTQNAVYLVEKRDRRELGEDDIAAIVAKEVKTRRESVEAGGGQRAGKSEQGDGVVRVGQVRDGLRIFAAEKFAGERNEPANER